MLIQAGGSPARDTGRGGFVDHVFGAGKGIPLMAQQRRDIDAALRERGRDPEQVGIIWATKVMVGETEDEAKAMRERLIADVPAEAVGVWLSHNTGFDMSTLPPRFSLRELNERIVAANASPVGFVGLLIEQYGQDGEITREEFMRYGLHAATGYATHPGRHRGADRRLPGGDLRGDRQPRRLHARPFAMRTARPAAEHRRSVGARIAAARPVPHRIYRPDLARKPRRLNGRRHHE